MNIEDKIEGRKQLLDRAWTAFICGRSWKEFEDSMWVQSIVDEFDLDNEMEHIHSWYWNNPRNKR